MSIQNNITTDEILAIPIDEILRYTGVAYVKKGDVLKLCDSSGVTDGWVGSLNKGLITDFSEKGRPSGNVFQFVKSMKQLDDKGTFDFFKQYKYGYSQFENVMIEGANRKIKNDIDIIKKEKSLIDMIDMYNKIESDKTDIKKYLAGRMINFETLPDIIKQDLKTATINFEDIWYKDRVFIPMKDIYEDENGILKSKIVGIKARAIGSDINPKYKSISIKNSSIGMFFSDEMLKVKKGNTIFICEGETDALALYSSGIKNVVGNLGGVGYTNKNFNKLFNRFSNIIIAYDNDEAGKNGIKKMVESIGFESNFWFIDFEKIKSNLISINPELKIKLDGKIDVNDILKLLDGNVDNFKKVLQKSTKAFNKGLLLKEIKKRDENNFKPFKK